MRTPLALLFGFLLSGTLAFAQGTVSEQASASGVQASSPTVNSVPNSNGTAPSNAGGMASRTSSAPNQALPGDANPANASAEGKVNGSAVRPDRSKSAVAGTDAGNAPGRDRNANRPENDNPTNPRTVNDISQPKLRSTMPWLWSGIGIVGALILIAILMNRSHSVEPERRQDATVLTMQDREKDRGDDQIRRAG